MLDKTYLTGNHALTTELPCKVTPARVLRLVSESPSMGCTTFYPATFYPATFYPATFYPATFYPVNFGPTTFYPVLLSPLRHFTPQANFVYRFMLW